MRLVLHLDAAGVAVAAVLALVGDAHGDGLVLDRGRAQRLEHASCLPIPGVFAGAVERDPPTGTVETDIRKLDVQLGHAAAEAPAAGRGYLLDVAFDPDRACVDRRSGNQSQHRQRDAPRDRRIHECAPGPPHGAAPGSTYPPTSETVPRESANCGSCSGSR